jgi:Zn-dependent peptidase ImmA (M78 family)
MAKEGIPINPIVLAWARQRSGLSLVEAVEKFSNFEAWEQGTVAPSYPQLEKLSDELKVPIAVFFFPEPPQVPPIRESFRTLPDAEFNHIPRRVQFLLRKAKALQLNLPELTQGRNPAPRLITRDLDFAANVSIDTMAARVREYLGIGIAEQQAWGDDDIALKAWRKALQGAGVFVFKDAFKAEGYSGFSLYDVLFPIIFVNNSSTKTRQIFTLFHELAHLLFHTSGIDTAHDDFIPNLPSQQRRIEVLCNQFAARFLVPTSAFDAAVQRFDHSEQTAELLAARFHVSREVIFRTFLERGWINETDYAQAARKWAGQRQSDGGSGGDHYWTKIAYLGQDYIRLAFSQYYQNRIDDEQLAEYLDTKPRNLSTLEDYFSRAPQ